MRGQCSDRPGEPAGGLVRDPDGRHAAPERGRSERAVEAAGAAGRQHVVGARDVVAEGGRALGADEDASGRRHGGREVARRRRAAGARAPARWRAPAPPRSKARRRTRWAAEATLSRSAASSATRLSSWASASASAPAATSRPSSPCSPWAQRSSASQPQIGALVEDHHQLARPGDAVDADAAVELPLGLRDVAVARSGDDVDRIDRLGAQRQRGDRLGSADRVRASAPPIAAAARTTGSIVPSSPGGLATAIRSTSATEAGTVHMRAVEG